MISCKKCNYWQSRDRTIGQCIKETDKQKSAKGINKVSIMKTFYNDFCNYFSIGK